MKKHKTNRNLDLIAVSITALAILVSVINVFLIQGMTAASSAPNATGQPAGTTPPAPVDVTILADSSCKDCINASSLTAYLQQAFGVNVQKEAVLEYTSAAAQALIQKYNITSVPAFIASAGMSSYGNLTQLWPQLGTVEPDGAYVLRADVPPYRSLSDGKIKGLVTLTNIVDGSCAECYDISLQKVPLGRLGVFIANESTYDVSSPEGRAYVDAFNITGVPTILLSPDAAAYANLNGVWPEVGTVESDGTYVFRNMDALGGVIYRDLATNTTVGLNVTVEDNGTSGNVTANSTADAGNSTANSTNSSG